MPIKEFKENLEAFQRLIDTMPQSSNDQVNMLTKRYIEQNIVILNELFATSLENLKRLEKAQTPNDIICTQARCTNEFNQTLSLSAQRFINASLGHISDYNEWLKAHCDFATE